MCVGLVVLIDGKWKMRSQDLFEFRDLFRPLLALLLVGVQREQRRVDDERVAGARPHGLHRFRNFQFPR